MSDEESSLYSIPSKLRFHIKEEKLRPDEKIFSRSLFHVISSALLPYVLVFAVVSASYFELLPSWLIVFFSFPLFLAAQRCLQTLVHDLSHKLFSIDIVRNDTLGNYLVAGWIGASVPAYRAIHLQHHKYNGSALDPEHISFELVQQRGGLLRHCLRYICGFEIARLVNKYYGRNASEVTSAQNQSSSLKSSKFHIIVCQALLASLLVLVVNAWYLYLIWLYLAVTWNPLLSNLRFLVEHPGESDLTISTPSNRLERLYFAPYNFNFHLEHHLWPNLPPYKLGLAHQYLVKQGYFARHPEFLGSGFINSLKKRDADG